MQGLKIYLSDPAIDIAFTASVSGKYEYGVYVQTLRLAVNPDQPFSQSVITYADADTSLSLQMDDADKNAWLVNVKPKLPPPARLQAP